MKQLAIIFAVLSALFIPNAAISQEAGKDELDYFGTLIGPGGAVFIGGPFEKDKQFLYMNPLDPGGGGGLFRMTSDGRMESIFPEGQILEWAFGLAGVPTSAVWHSDEPTPKRLDFKPLKHMELVAESAGATIRGTLFLPEGKGPFPVVVLVHGSGDADRRAGPWVPFFTNLGIAVIAYDKRGVGQSEGEWRQGGYGILAEDAIRMAAAASHLEMIDATRVGIHASSEGGWLAPIIVRKAMIDPDIPPMAFVIVRAGPAQPAPEVFRHELRNDLAADGHDAATIEHFLQYWMEVVDPAIKSGLSYQSFLKTAVKPFQGESWYTDVLGADGVPYGPKTWTFIVHNANYDPADYLSYITMPLLWFLADQDENVPYASTLHALRRGVPGDNLQLVTIRGANHAFFLKESDGKLTYTNDYFSKMAQWFEKIGVVED